MKTHNYSKFKPENLKTPEKNFKKKTASSVAVCYPAMLYAYAYNIRLALSRFCGEASQRWLNSKQNWAGLGWLGRAQAVA